MSGNIGGVTIADRWREIGGSPSGFDYLRLALAILILFWHSYQVSYGTYAAVAFWQDARGTLLPLILPCFFALSGFLVSGSLYRNPDLKTFLSLRMIRIFPALSVESVLAAMVLGPALTTYSLAQYFSDPRFPTYFLNMVGDIHYFLPGVFAANPETGYVNGQLWTVPYELLCYVALSLFYLIGAVANRRLLLVGFAGSTSALAVWNALHDSPALTAVGLTGRMLVLCFLGGVVIHAYRDRIVWRASLAVGCGGLALLVLRFYAQRAPFLVYITPILIAYVTVYIGLLNPRRSVVIDAGDFSYGIYLYSCPLQQAVAAAFGVRGGWAQNVAISLPICLCFSLLSWRCVEKPFVKLRRFIGAKPSPTHS